MRPGFRLLPLVVVLACALAAAVDASAAGVPGLHVDPASPVAKAYALPLGNVRGAPSGSGARGTLFGSGITHTVVAHRADYRVRKPAPGVGLALMGLIALVVVAIGAAGVVTLSRRR